MVSSEEMWRVWVGGQRNSVSDVKESKAETICQLVDPLIDRKLASTPYYHLLKCAFLCLIVNKISTGLKYVG